ncbi:hypothetical protein J421_1837 [Gemmatirosa kalamazoonensis]|uniref:Uncharacterized protein n=1 Tax=Gemmatirosa kalamazoonensis TaxID=861299 RepID=W0RE50_9BACT|nr:hypothetical protein [Gemmatirosa kalamazoonensis]AHG89374.1 hypothetical protein J421_1837 [Gemmatirosa kalamazoonensis]
MTTSARGTTGTAGARAPAILVSGVVTATDARLAAAESDGATLDDAASLTLVGGSLAAAGDALEDTEGTEEADK